MLQVTLDSKYHYPTGEHVYACMIINLPEQPEHRMFKKAYEDPS